MEKFFAQLNNNRSIIEKLKLNKKSEDIFSI